MDDRNTLERIARAIEMSSREIERSREIIRKIEERHRRQLETVKPDRRATHPSSALDEEKNYSDLRREKR